MSVSKAMWEVDPETRRKLSEIQKVDGNNICCDCGAPAPQWASPKFGIFICLSCAGIHRGLGVHISFVRSVSMDAFKNAEILRMQNGGNKTWQTFYEQHETTKMQGMTWEDSTIADRYSGPVGEEYKERLTAKIEGREYVPGEKSKDESPAASGRNSKATSLSGSRSNTPVGGRKTTSNLANSTSSLRSSSPGSGLGGGTLNSSTSRKTQNETYFAKLGAENASRPADLPPNQGGKYAGFGSGFEPAANRADSSSGSALPGVDEFSKDPVAALTKGFGWFTTAVGQSAKTVNDSWIQPTAQKLAETDLTQFKEMGAQLSQTVSTGVTNGANFTAEQLNRFVDPEGQKKTTRGQGSAPKPERQDFWDSFGALDPSTSSTAASQPPRQSKPSGGSVGTSTIKKTATKKDDDKWDDF